MSDPARISAEARIINLWWLLRLRWVAIVGQLAIIFAVDLLLGIDLPLLPILAIVGFELLTNALGTLWARQAVHVTERLLAGLLGIDVALLTGLLYLTGGPVNPFTFLYMVHIALAAVSLQAAQTWALTALSLLGFGLLFWLPPWDGTAGAAHSHLDHMRLHLEGMYVAFGMAAMLIVYFVQRVRAALAQREAELATARHRAERHEKFASLATLAAGAAHELSTPLSTIAVVARELERTLARLAGSAESIADVRLIRDQVTRCHDILQQLAADAGQGTGEHPVEVSPSELVAQSLDGLRDHDRIVVDIEPPAGAAQLTVPRRAVARALRGVVKNAQQASGVWRPVEVRVRLSGTDLRFEVHDHGAGMAAVVLERAGEPFFTTKAPGEGMGLGLFLARSLLSGLGGRLELDSSPGQGTTAVLILPASVGSRALTTAGAAA